MQRTVYCMRFVVEWFIGTQWAAFGFEKRWTAWPCLSLCLSVAYSFGCFTLFPRTFLSPPLDTPKFFQFSFPFSPFAILIFPLCLPLITSIHVSFTKSVSNLWIPSPPLLYFTQKLQGVCRPCEYLFYRVLFEEALSFLFLAVGTWQDEQQRAWPLDLVCGFCDRHKLAPAACGQWNVAVEFMPKVLVPDLRTANGLARF